MHVFLPEIAARPAPRYTSYPTAMEFSPAIGAREQGDALIAQPAGSTASLYLHVPYCKEICWYCGCNTGAIGRPQRLDSYVSALLAEIATVATLYRGRITGIHFGGGSPNALLPAQFQQVCDAIRDHFDVTPDAEWAVELDPRLLDSGYAAALGASGITRASLGAQTFAPHIQARINRFQPFRQVARGIAALRDAGISRINLDLMYGLPGQKLDDIAASIAQGLRLAPDRIAMFGYAHVPATLPRQRMIDATTLPDTEARFWQSALAQDLLREAGYQPIGFDHFARADDSLSQAAHTGALRRNFQGFSDDPADTVIGLGASAISQFGDRIVQNEKHVGNWREQAVAGRLAGVRGTWRTADDRLRGAIIEQLLCDGEADIAEFVALHGEPDLGELERLNVVRRDGSRVTITDPGRPYARLAAVKFDAFRTSGARSMSRAV